MAEAFNFSPTLGGGKASAIADFAELECLKRDDLSVSFSDIRYAFHPAAVSEDEGEDGTTGGAAEANVSQAFDEVDERQKHCGRNAFYPFRRKGESRGQVAMAAPADNGQGWHALLYLFLLWLTRIGGNVPQAHAARTLFERLCCDVARSYWGRDAAGNPARVIHFGKSGNFPAKIDALARQLGEPGGFNESLRNLGGQQKDGGVDIVVHRPFADGRAGQLLGFGQCKSGHGYEWGDLTKLEPDAFKLWFREPVSYRHPARLFFLSDRVADDKRMRHLSALGGIVFDRCRVMEYAGNVDRKLQRAIAAWMLDRLGESGIIARLDAAGIDLRRAVVI